MPMLSLLPELLIGAVGAVGIGFLSIGMLLTVNVDETLLSPKERCTNRLLTIGAVLGMAFLVLRLVFLR